MTTSGAKRQRCGGPFFFFSLLALLFVATWNVRFLIAVLATWGMKFPLLLTAGVALGWMISQFLFRAHFATFIHELKHSVVSNLVGNKAKEMRIRRNSGHFQYEYTKDTARYNAFISLAPYCFPLFTVPLLGIAAWLIPDRTLAVLAVGVALGADLQCGWRDVGPYQTDFSDLRGGYFIGLVYVTAASITLVTFVLAWAAGGWDGVGVLVGKYLGTLTTLLGVGTKAGP